MSFCELKHIWTHIFQIFFGLKCRAVVLVNSTSTRLTHCGNRHAQPVITLTIVPIICPYPTPKEFLILYFRTAHCLNSHHGSINAPSPSVSLLLLQNSLEPAAAKSTAQAGPSKPQSQPPKKPVPPCAHVHVYLLSAPGSLQKQIFN